MNPPLVLVLILMSVLQSMRSRSAAFHSPLILMKVFKALCVCVQSHGCGEES